MGKANISIKSEDDSIRCSIEGNADDLMALYAKITLFFFNSLPEMIVKKAFELGYEDSKKEGIS